MNLELLKSRVNAKSGFNQLKAEDLFKAEQKKEYEACEKQSAIGGSERPAPRPNAMKHKGANETQSQ